MFNGEIVVSPVYRDGIVFLQLWRQSQATPFDLLATGSRRIRCGSAKSRAAGPSPVYYRGLLYALMDNGVLVSLDGKTGKEICRQRLGGACNSSLITGGGRINLSHNGGKTFVVKAGRGFELPGTNSLGQRITASPAVSGNEFLYRTGSHVYSILKKQLQRKLNPPWVLR
jgi:outer membrane protein assembly factor BamB